MGLHLSLVLHEQITHMQTPFRGKRATIRTRSHEESSSAILEFLREKNRMHPLVERPNLEEFAIETEQNSKFGEVNHACLPEDSPTKSDKEGRIDLEDLSKWFTDHVRELKTSAAGNSQLAYIETNIAPRLDAYRDNIERNQGGNRTPRTRGNRDIVFLP